MFKIKPQTAKFLARAIAKAEIGKKTKNTQTAITDAEPDDSYVLFKTELIDEIVQFQSDEKLTNENQEQAKKCLEEKAKIFSNAITKAKLAMSEKLKAYESQIAKLKKDYEKSELMVQLAENNLANVKAELQENKKFYNDLIVEIKAHQRNQLLM